VGLEINLQFTAKSVAELREQLTAALSELNGSAVVETPNKATKTERPSAETPKKEKKPKRPKKTVRRPKAPKASLECKSCKATSTPQWRRKTAPEGPLCNACHMKLYKAERAAKNSPKESSAERSRRIRQEKIGSAAASKKKNKPKVEKLEFEPAEKIEADMSTEAFYLWAQSYLPGMVMRDKTFLVASKVIETWFTTLRPQSEYDKWCLKNLQTFTDETRKMFEVYQKVHPTILMIQDAGDNVVLMVNNPSALTFSKLEGLLE